MTIDINGMNQIPENTNYGASNGYIPQQFMNGSSWRDSTQYNNPWSHPPPHINSWMPSENNCALSSMPLPTPVSECVILDQDPHDFRQLPPPPIPPILPQIMHPMAASSFVVENSMQPYYFFNPPSSTSIIYNQPMSISGSSTSSSTPPLLVNNAIQEARASRLSRPATPDNNLYESLFTGYPVIGEAEPVHGESNASIGQSNAEIPSTRREEERRQRRRSRSRSPLRHDHGQRMDTTRRYRDRDDDKGRNNQRKSPAARRKRSLSPPIRRKRSLSPLLRRKRSQSPARSSEKSRRRRSTSRSRRYVDDEKRSEKSPGHASHRSRRSLSPKTRAAPSSKSQKENGNKEKKKPSKAPVKEVQNTVEKQLQAFAEEAGDPAAMLKKLKQKMMDKLKKTIDEPQIEDTASEACSTDKTIKLYYTDSSNGKNVEQNAAEENEYVVTKPSRESARNSNSSCEEEEIYPWYRNSPLQCQIGIKFLKSKGMEFDSRPQKDEEDSGIIRTFPKRSKVIKPYNLLASPHAEPQVNTNANIVKEAGAGFIVQRNGAMSWVSKTLMSNAAAASFNARPPQNNAVKLNNWQPPSNECFEYMSTKICQAGALCKYKHCGQDEHRKIRFCQKFLNGLCRDGDHCPKGSHALLRHQLPVCGYYLRGTCSYLKGCQFLHVKNSANARLCVHFNKGKCLADFPCVYIHRYCTTVIRERCGGQGFEEDANGLQSEESRIASFDQIPQLKWFEED